MEQVANPPLGIQVSSEICEESGGKVSFLLFQDRTVLEGRELPDRCRTSGLGPSGVPANCKDPGRLNTLSEASLTKTFVALKRFVAERREYDGRRDVCSSRSVSTTQAGDACFSIESGGTIKRSSPPVVVSIQPDDSGSQDWGQAVQRGLVRELQSAPQQPSDPAPFKLTIVVPVFNEERTVRQVLEALTAQPVPGDFEIIVVDDGSTDRTKDILQASWHNRRVCVRHETNRGKGAAVRTGISLASGTHLLVFDADSEYDPDDIPSLIAPILSGRAEVVYGVRVRGAGAVFPSFVNVLGNRVMTAVTNLLYGSAISDLHTCLKLLPTPMLRLMQLEEEGFGLDTEISAEMLRRGFRPFEIPVGYVGRSRAEGKKIRLSDAFRCLQVLLKVRLRGRTQYGARDKSIVPRVSMPEWSEAANAAGPLSRGVSRVLHA